MRHVPALLRRELAAYFLGPIAYLVLLGFQAIALVDFWQLIGYLSDPRVVNAYSSARDPLNAYVSGSVLFWMAQLAAVPALTMRLLAEERRSGTIEGLLTAPVTEAEVVLAKWLAGFLMYLVLLLPFALYLPFLRYLGGFAFDPGPTVSLGLGLASLGLMFVAIGLFFSSLTRHQIVAAIGTFGVLFFLVVVTLFVHNLAVEIRSPWERAIGFVAVIVQAQEFGRGRLDLRHLALHGSVALLMVYLTIKVLEYRRGGA